MKIRSVDIKGKEKGFVELQIPVVEKSANFEHHVYLVNKFQKAKSHQGTASTKTRSEVSGGGAKPYKQKGTGNARRGTSRSPLRPGGGIVFGPKPRSFDIELNSGLVQNAFLQAFNEKKDVLSLLDVDGINNLKTKDVKALVGDGKTSSKALFVVWESDDEVVKACGNLASCKLGLPTSLGILDLLASDHVYVTKSAAKKLEELYQL